MREYPLTTSRIFGKSMWLIKEELDMIELLTRWYPNFKTIQRWVTIEKYDVKNHAKKCAQHQEINHNDVHWLLLLLDINFLGKRKKCSKYMWWAEKKENFTAGLGNRREKRW